MESGDQTEGRVVTDSKNLRLKRIAVSGFKALHEFDLTLNDDTTLIIGPNGSGKSSILQLLDFVRSFASGAPQEFFSERNWPIESVRTFADAPTGIVIGMLFRHKVENINLLWTIAWGLRLGESVFEKISILTPSKDGELEKQTVLRYSRKEKTLTRAGADTINGIQLDGSVFSILPKSSGGQDDPMFWVQEIKDWAHGIRSLELLNPRDMRSGTRGTKTDIGPRGQHLASFISSLDSTAKSRLFDRISLFYPCFKELNTVRKRAGWVDLKLREIYYTGSQISANHVSDGFLRLLALAAIPEFRSDVSLVMLDEVENGVAPHFIKHIVSEINEKGNFQLLLTSHSPLLVNHFEPEDIIFVSRSEDGHAITARFDEIDDAMRDLEFQGPGEIWSHTSDKVLTKWVRKAWAHRKENIETETMNALQYRKPHPRKRVRLDKSEK